MMNSGSSSRLYQSITKPRFRCDRSDTDGPAHGSRDVAEVREDSVGRCWSALPHPGYRALDHLADLSFDTILLLRPELVEKNPSTEHVL